jgi:hydrogenase maturation factor
MASKFEFTVEYGTEDEAVDAAFVLADGFKSNRLVKSWKLIYEPVRYSNRTVVCGQVEVFDDEDLLVVACDLGVVAADTGDFTGGAIWALD